MERNLKTGKVWPCLRDAGLDEEDRAGAVEADQNRDDKQEGQQEEQGGRRRQGHQERGGRRRRQATCGHERGVPARNRRER